MLSDLGAAVGRRIRRRIAVVGSLFGLVCFGTLIARLFYIQLIENSFYTQRAAGQQLRGITVNAPRGGIYDTNMNPLAVSVSAWTIRASPREIADDKVPAAAAALAQILELDEASVRKKLDDRKSNDKLIARAVDRVKADAVNLWCTEQKVEGILVLEDTRRVYPEGNMGGSILGFVNVDGDGVAGVELEYNKLLKGRNGSLLSAKNAWGYPMPDLYETLRTPTSGNSLVLTIDTAIQHYLENHLSRAVEEHHVGARAAGIVMDVNTGAILAMSTKPDYDPNSPRTIANEPLRAQIDAMQGEERTAALQQAQQEQWRNKAVSDLYEPGSVFKLITAAAALDSGAVTPSSTFVCQGAIHVAGTRFRCANGRVHGAQNIDDALMHSCNPSFIQIGAALGAERFCQYFQAFGLAEATGVDLPAEPKKSQHYTADRMGPVELASCSFGQSSKITPLQMITAVSAVVNGGKLMQPYLVSAVLDENGTICQRIEPQVKRQVIHAKTSAKMRQMMKYTVDSGPGKNAYVAGMRVGGKSGTSQKLDSEDPSARIASFVGIAPAENPKIAVLVLLDEPHTFTTAGGTLAAPVVGQVLRDTLEYLEVQPVYTEAERKTLDTTVPNLVGKSNESASAQLAQAGLGSSTRGGSGTVTSQHPAAGTILPRGSTVVLYTENAAEEIAVVPSLNGATPEQTALLLRRAGLNIRTEGAALANNVQAVWQDIAAGTTLPLGSTVTVGFYDTGIPED